MFQIKMLCQYGKDSFTAPSTNAVKNFNMSQKNSVNLEPKQLSTIAFYILNIFITFLNKKLLQKWLNRKLSSLTRYCSLPTFTSSETITNFTRYELSQEESDLLKTGLYFSIPPDKIQKSKIFTTFEKIHHSFINSSKSAETKNHIKTHLSYLSSLLFLQLQTFSTYTLSTSCLTKP